MSLSELDPIAFQCLQDLKAKLAAVEVCCNKPLPEPINYCASGSLGDLQDGDGVVVCINGQQAIRNFKAPVAPDGFDLCATPVGSGVVLPDDLIPVCNGGEVSLKKLPETDPPFDPCDLPPPAGDLQEGSNVLVCLNGNMVRMTFPELPAAGSNPCDADDPTQDASTGEHMIVCNGATIEKRTFPKIPEIPAPVNICAGATATTSLASGDNVIICNGTTVEKRLFPTISPGSDPCSVAANSTPAATNDTIIICGPAGLEKRAFPSIPTIPDGICDLAISNTDIQAGDLLMICDGGVPKTRRFPVIPASTNPCSVTNSNVEPTAGTQMLVCDGTSVQKRSFPVIPASTNPCSVSTSTTDPPAGTQILACDGNSIRKYSFPTIPTIPTPPTPYCDLPNSSVALATNDTVVICGPNGPEKRTVPALGGTGGGLTCADVTYKVEHAPKTRTSSADTVTHNPCTEARSFYSPDGSIQNHITKSNGVVYTDQRLGAGLRSLNAEQITLHEGTNLSAALKKILENHRDYDETHDAQTKPLQRVTVYLEGEDWDLTGWSTMVLPEFSHLTIVGNGANLKGPGSSGFIQLTDGSSLSIRGVNFLDWENVITAVPDAEIKYIELKNVNASRCRSMIDIGSDATCDWIVGEGGTWRAMYWIGVEFQGYFQMAHFRNIEVSSSSSSSGASYGGFWMGSDEIPYNGQLIVENCFIHDFFRTADCHGVIAFSSTNTIRNNNIQRILNSTLRDNEGVYTKGGISVIENNDLIDAGYAEGSIAIKGVRWGFPAPGSNQTEMNLVKNNRISWTADQATRIARGYTGIVCKRGNHRLEGNTVRGALRAIRIEGGDDPEEKCTNIWITKNLLEQSLENAIQVRGCESGLHIIDNEIFETGYAGSTDTGRPIYIQVNGSGIHEDYYIRGNTIKTNLGSANSNHGIYFSVSGVLFLRRVSVIDNKIVGYDNGIRYHTGGQMTGVITDQNIVDQTGVPTIFSGNPANHNVGPTNLAL